MKRSQEDDADPTVTDAVWRKLRSDNLRIAKSFTNSQLYLTDE